MVLSLHCPRTELQLSVVHVQHIARLVRGLQQVQMCRNCTRGGAAAWIVLMYAEQVLLRHPKLSFCFQLPVQILASVRG